MSDMKQWAVNLSVISILSGLLLALLPQSTHKKVFKVVVSILLIYASILPFIGSKSIDFNLSDYMKDNYQVSENTDKYALSAIVRSAEKTIENILTEKAESENLKLNFKCYCEIADDAIEIKKISVSPTPDTTAIDKLENIIVSMGFEASVLYFEGEDDEH